MEKREDYKGLQIGKTYNIGWISIKHIATFEGYTDGEIEGETVLFFKAINPETKGLYFPQSEDEEFAGCIGFTEPDGATAEELEKLYKFEEDEDTEN